MLTTIERYIQNKGKDWELDSTPKEQLKKVITILKTNDFNFVCNDEKYGIYQEEDVSYGNHQGKEFTIDIDSFSSQIEECLENWWIPTVEGPLVDIWLIQ